MNRKFFTWVAGTLLLAASLSTANAQTGAGTAIGKLGIASGSDSKLYQLRASTAPTGAAEFVLTVNANGILEIDSVGLDKGFTHEYGESLWCFSITAGAQGQSPKIDFTNRAKSFPLTVSTDDVVPQTTTAVKNINVLQGSRAGWGFSTVYEKSIESNKPLYTYFSNDSVLVLGVKTQTNETYDEDGNVVSSVDKARLVVVKAGADEVIGKNTAFKVPIDANGTSDPNGTSILLFSIWEPAPIALTALDFNTILSTKTEGATTLKFSRNNSGVPDVNLWSGSLRATESKDVIGAVPRVDGSGRPYLNFSATTGGIDSAKFVRVDTAYVNGSGTQFLAFNTGRLGTWSTNEDDERTWTNSKIRSQYDFSVKYYVSNDSIEIEAREAISGPGGDGTWINGNKVTDTYRHVILQDFPGSRIVTLGCLPVATKIQLGLTCGGSASTEYTSLANDVYIITKGDQVYGVPIYKGTYGDYIDSKAQWITFNPDNVDPKYIPAYQWIVKKIRTDEGSSATSPVTLTNREYPDLKVLSLQLTTNNSTGKLGYGDDAKSVTTSNFTPLPAAQKGDPYLGYFHITRDEANFNTYALNYFHNFSSDYYLGKSTIASDTTLIVKDVQTEFKIAPVGANYDDDGNDINLDMPYGYVVQKGDISGLVQLKRTRYFTLNDGNSSNTKYVSTNAESRFVLSPNSSTSFILKTYNTKVNEKGEVVQYYALRGSSEGSNKLSISDDNLWAYSTPSSEQRTSSFAVSEFSAPLYRKFDGGTYTYGNGLETTPEPFGQEDNSPLWLKFGPLYSRGYELLFENADASNEFRQGLTEKGKDISFLGLLNRATDPETDNFKYTFYVDTAYVNRPATASSAATPPPTPKPQYMLALRPQVEKPGWVYWKGGDASWTDDEDEPDLGNLDRDSAQVLGLTRGFYLFNAQDSVNVGNADYAGKAAYGGTRLAFVDGVHRADTFYVLTPTLQAKTTRQLQRDTALLYGLPAVNKHYLGDNTSFAARYEDSSYGYPKYTFVKNDSSDPTPTAPVKNGKSMVFQFRLIGGENAQRSFLIESAKSPSSYYSEIAPTYASYIQIKNGVPIVAWVNTSDPLQQTSAEVFNVVEGEEGQAVANEKIAATSKVRVVSGAGSVNILNATGKKVTVTNILGQNLATQVLSSNNARISLPQGIVVVAVEGEPAVKAFVSR